MITPRMWTAFSPATAQRIHPTCPSCGMVTESGEPCDSCHIPVKSICDYCGVLGICTKDGNKHWCGCMFTCTACKTYARCTVEGLDIWCGECTYRLCSDDFLPTDSPEPEDWIDPLVKAEIEEWSRYLAEIKP